MTPADRIAVLEASRCPRCDREECNIGRVGFGRSDSRGDRSCFSREVDWRRRALTAEVALDAERAAHARTQAEAAAMREAASDLLSHIVVYITPQSGGLFDMLCKALNSAVTGDAGRAIAERMPLWRELEAAIRVLLDFGVINCNAADPEGLCECGGCAICNSLSKLAALDATK